jgi:hypothetical protein
MATTYNPRIVTDGLVLGLDAGNTKSFNINNGDLNFSNVSLLLKGDGTNGSTNITDSSSNAHSVTANGDAQISTNQSKFGGSSLYFDGNGDSITVPDSSDWHFGSDDFTIEVWVYPTAITNTSAQIACQWGNTGTSGTWLFSMSGTNIQAYFQGSTTVGGSPNVSVNTSFSFNQWQHIAVVRNGTTLSIYLNGTLSQSDTMNFAVADAPESLSIGRQLWTSYRGGEPYQGYMDDLRITKGVARYTDDFTPPTASLPDGAPQWVDVIGSNNGTLVNGPTFNSDNGGSIVFDGTDDYLSIADNSDLILGVNDFTIECWAYLRSVNSGNANPIVNKVNGMSNNGWLLGTSNTGLWQFSTGSSVIVRAGNVSLNTWTHIAAVRSSGTTVLYVNGVSVGSDNTSYNFTDTVSLLIGFNSSFVAIDGYISNLRIYKGKGHTSAEVFQNYNALKGRFGI